MARLSEEEAEILRSVAPERPIPAWAFRFLQSIPCVTMTLSGMSDPEQMKDNLRTFETEEPLSEQEWEAVLSLGRRMASSKALACTACSYCVSHCPQGLDIPHLLSLFNEHFFTGGGFIAPMALAAIDPGKRPDACLGCRSCEAVCPQQLKISEAMAEFASLL